jgi:hypothetical protein
MKISDISNNLSKSIEATHETLKFDQPISLQLDLINAISLNCDGNHNVLYFCLDKLNNLKQLVDDDSKYLDKINTLIFHISEQIHSERLE